MHLAFTINLKGVKDMAIERVKLRMDGTCQEHAQYSMEKDEHNLLKSTV